jgi:hypothetical protein
MKNSGDLILENNRFSIFFEKIEEKLKKTTEYLKAYKLAFNYTNCSSIDFMILKTCEDFKVNIGKISDELFWVSNELDAGIVSITLSKEEKEKIDDLKLKYQEIRNLSRNRSEYCIFILSYLHIIDILRPIMPANDPIS